MKKEIISEIMANGERNRPKDSQTDWNRLDNMSDEETHQNALSDPDAQPLSKDAKPFVNVKLIRAKLSMTQEEFAKTFQTFFGDYKRLGAKEIPTGSCCKDITKGD